jgi:putative cardiolipin synthase
LLRAHVELHEVKARPGNARGTGQPASMSSYGAFGLHAKLFVFDRRRVFIGSMNFDRRSATLNTEIGLLIDSPELATQVAARFAEMTQPANAYRVELVEGSDGSDHLRWRSLDEDGRMTTTRLEPARSNWQRFKLGWSMLLPIDDEL